MHAKSKVPHMHLRIFDLGQPLFSSYMLKALAYTKSECRYRVTGC